MNKALWLWRDVIPLSTLIFHDVNSHVQTVSLRYSTNVLMSLGWCVWGGEKWKDFFSEWITPYARLHNTQQQWGESHQAGAQSDLEAFKQHLTCCPNTAFCNELYLTKGWERDELRTLEYIQHICSYSSLCTIVKYHLRCTKGMVRVFWSWTYYSMNIFIHLLQLLVTQLHILPGSEIEDKCFGSDTDFKLCSTLSTGKARTAHHQSGFGPEADPKNVKVRSSGHEGWSTQ